LSGAPRSPDPEGSHGFVSFRVAPRAGLPEGTVIENTAGIVFDQNSPVITNTVRNTLTYGVTECGCSAFSLGACEPPMGKAKKLGSTLPIKVGISYRGTPIASEEAFYGILASDFGWTPERGCWPRLRVFTADGATELPLDEGNYSATPDNPDECFRFADGRLIFNLRLDPAIFVRGQSYKVEVNIFGCSLAPSANGEFQVK
jgi:hypothetical protein